MQAHDGGCDEARARSCLHSHSDESRATEYRASWVLGFETKCQTYEQQAVAAKFSCSEGEHFMEVVNLNPKCGNMCERPVIGPAMLFNVLVWIEPCTGFRR